ncbi:MAG: large-conductance mechanosensitive channel protein MscL [Oscillospiraceae bacterium]|jgi:large conductance mechanosensitive channel|nr:large-conductance mechanosensitive channel protein MscL [Oscillospiraceae bacterium]
MKRKGDSSRLKKFMHEFRSFAVKGNMIDMAVGIIVGGAFTALISSIVGHIATPLIGILIGVDFSTWKINLPRLYGNAVPGTLDIGEFLNSAISFIIVTFIVFLFVRGINRLRSTQEAAPPVPPKPTAEEKLLAEIRDLLKASAADGNRKNSKVE